MSKFEAASGGLMEKQRASVINRSKKRKEKKNENKTTREDYCITGVI